MFSVYFYKYVFNSTKNEKVRSNFAILVLLSQQNMFANMQKVRTRQQLVRLEAKLQMTIVRKRERENKERYVGRRVSSRKQMRTTTVRMS